MPEDVKRSKGGEKEADGHFVITAALNGLVSIFFSVTNVTSGEPEQPGENLFQPREERRKQNRTSFMKGKGRRC